MVSAHDRLGTDMWDLFNAGPDEKLWFYGAIADTVTEMREVKHAYRDGIRAKRGIDY